MEILSVLYLLVFALSGVMISRYVFSGDKLLKRVFFGLVFGLLMLLWLPVLLRLFMGYRVQRANYRPATDDDFFRLVRRGGGQGGGMDAAHRPEEGDHHARYAEGHPARARRA